MTAKRKTKPPEKREVLSSENPNDRARMAVFSEISGAVVMDRFNVYDRLDLWATAQELVSRGNDVVKGDTAGMQRMLISQAHALESIFVKESRRASAQEYLPQFEAHLKLALRAQNQCRMTLETLAAIKNPPVVFAKQANIAHGHQQVNNGEGIPVARAGESGKPQTELLEAPHAKPEWVDAGAARAATPSDSEVATVEAIDGTAHQGRQGNVKP